MSKKKVWLNLIVILFILPMVFASFSDVLDFFKIKNAITGFATSSTTSLNISIGNTAPIVANVSTIQTQSITEASATRIEFTFIVTDVDGNSNINDTTLRAQFNKTGETTRFNNTCRRLSNLSTNQANFSCTVDLWYYDSAGGWDVNVSIKDLNNAVAENTTTNFSLGESTNMVMSPTSLTWPSFSVTAVNQTSNNDPIIINNTGNKNVSNGSITVTGKDLVGETTNTQSIFAGNFTVDVNNTGGSAPNLLECRKTQLVNNTITNITSSNVTRGNNSAGNGQAYLYFCLTQVSPSISSQPYSTAQLGAWTVAVA